MVISPKSTGDERKNSGAVTNLPSNRVEGGFHNKALLYRATYVEESKRKAEPATHQETVKLFFNNLEQEIK